MRRRIVDIAASGAVCSVMTAALMFFSGLQGHGETASRASDTEARAGSKVQVKNAPSSQLQEAKKNCVLRAWRPSIRGKGTSAQVVGYGSIICDKPGYIAFEVSLCQRIPGGRWACNTSENSLTVRKWGSYVQAKATIPCDQTSGRETYRTAVVGDVVEGWDEHREKSGEARLHCPG
ncbi:hypothetical protein GCM10023088_41810 [Actinomadura verrucosospora]